MNNPADTLAALADKLETQAGRRVPKWTDRPTQSPPMRYRYAEDTRAFMTGIAAELRAIASLKGEAEPVGYLFRGCADRRWQFEEGEIPQIVTDSLDTMLVYTTPPPQPEPQPATGGEFCLICDMPSGEMAYCSTCASVGIAEAWVNRPGQSKTTPPAPQAGTAVGRLAHLLDELAKLFPEAVDPLASDPPELRYLEAIRALATQPQQAPTPSPAPQGGGERGSPLSASLPERIWLQVDTDADPEDTDEPFTGDLSDLSWCAEEIGGLEVEYVRADLATPPAQQPGECAHVNDVLAEDGVRFCNVCGAPKEKGNE